MLDLVYDHDATQTLKGGHGFGEECSTCRVLQVEVVAGSVGHYFPRQSSLPALSRADQGNDTASPKATAYAVKQSSSFQHRRRIA